MANLQDRLDALGPDVLRGLQRGIERETLRVRPDGTLADTPHPPALGAALTHPHITTDFGEAQLELVTGVDASVDACVEELTGLHQFVSRNLGDELMWSCSMPCELPPDDAIAIARYGTSNRGRLKHVYRTGLSRRYGRRMQAICGIHYNFSVPDGAWPALQRLAGDTGPTTCFRDDAYFGLIRNFRRHAWLVLYLIGASPAVARSFVAGRTHRLQPLDAQTLHLPFATSLRMGPFGYQSDAQRALGVSYNSLETYGDALRRGLAQVHPPYEEIGLKCGDDYRQLAPTLLQIENEFYGTIRPKRRVAGDERPLRALIGRGVEYVEVRLIDIDPFCATGIDAPTMRLLDIFLLHCLLADSPRDTPAESAEVTRNQHCVAERGREPGLELNRDGSEVAMDRWAHELLEACGPVAQALDRVHGGTVYRDILASASAAFDDPSRTPSARVLDRIVDAHDGSFMQFGLALAKEHHASLAARPFADGLLERQRMVAQRSLAAQRKAEDDDAMPFDEYRRAYLEQDLSPVECADHA